ncbi:MAG: glycosyltransferase [Candidatus Omnitrophota bacterium]|nr:glycosyltransferase [Candidatus Omnitrophota bacterium]
MKNFSIILPTRSRPAMVKRFLDSVVETAWRLDELEVVIRLDEDDLESRKISHPSLSITKLIMPRSDNMGDFIRTCYEGSKGRFIALMNDDVVFRTKDWDEKVLKVFSRFPDGAALVYGNDLYYGSKLATFPILSRAACELMGGLSLPSYRSHSIDSHIFDIFERLARKGHKRHIYLSDVIFEHMNYGVSTATYDTDLSEADPHEDDRRLYIALAGERQLIADKMAQHVEEYAKKTSKAPKQAISLIIRIDEGKTRDAAASIKAICDDNKSENLAFETVIVSAAESLNSAAAFNKGAAAAKGEYLIFLEGGVTFERGWIKALLEAAEDEQVGIVGSRWLNPRNGRVEHMGISFFDDNGIIKDTFIYKGLPSGHSAAKRKRELQAVKIAGALIKKDIFVAAKGFNESLTGKADIDLCLKVGKLGRKIICLPEATIYYCEEEPVASYLSSGQAGHLTCDLEKFLSEDGFSLAEKHIEPVVFGG